MPSPHFNDLSGMQFHYLTIMYRVINNKVHGTRYKCKCKCGKEFVARATNIITGTTKSCGCYRKECMRAFNRRIQGRGNKPKLLQHILTPEQVQLIYDLAHEGKTLNYTAGVLKYTYNRLETYVKKKPELYEQFRRNSNKYRKVTD